MRELISGEREFYQKLAARSCPDEPACDELSVPHCLILRTKTDLTVVLANRLYRIPLSHQGV